MINTMFALSLISAVLIGLLIGALLEPYVFRNSPDLFSEEWKEGDFGDKF